MLNNEWKVDSVQLLTNNICKDINIESSNNSLYNKKKRRQQSNLYSYNLSKFLNLWTTYHSCICSEKFRSNEVFLKMDCLRKMEWKILRCMFCFLTRFFFFLYMKILTFLQVWNECVCFFFFLLFFVIFCFFMNFIYNQK